MWLLVGLGNPGPQYARHRHNVGFMALEEVARRWQATSRRRRFQGELAEVRLEGERLLLLWPHTFMNESGRAVAEAARYYRIPPERIVVFHDELDLPPGRVRIRRGGGTAGHRGLESIARHLGTRDFWRVRIGIGHPGQRERVVGWVLADLPKAERERLEPILETLAEGLPELLAGRTDRLQQRLAELWRKLQAADASKTPS